MIRILLILLILLLVYNSSKATSIENDSLIRISAQVVVAKSFTPIPLSHIIVKGKRSGQICDSLGTFHLQVKQSDTLIISALGYETKQWAIPLIFDTTLPSFFQIPLKKMAYLLNEVDVFAFGTWDEFKADFLKLEIKYENVINKQITKELAPFQTKAPSIIPPQYRPIIEDISIWDVIGTPASFFYSKFSRKEKSKRKVAKMIRIQWKSKKIKEFYTSDIVSAHTGLNGQALEDFMAYCGPKLKITKISSRYDIAEQIGKNYKWYIELNKAK